VRLAPCPPDKLVGLGRLASAATVVLAGVGVTTILDFFLLDPLLDPPAGRLDGAMVSMTLSH
jgi:hypothetical protein